MKVVLQFLEGNFWYEKLAVVVTGCGCAVVENICEPTVIMKENRITATRRRGKEGPNRWKTFRTELPS